MNLKVLVAIILVIIAIGVAVYLLPGPVEPPTESVTKTFALRIEKKTIVEGPRTITVNMGDTVSIIITSDEKEEFHIHGYDRSIGLEPNIPATLTLTAAASGRFEFELEESKTDIGALEILP